MPWGVVAGAVISGVAAYGSANAQKSAAQNAANASQQAMQQSIAEQQREFNIEQQNLAPWLSAGTSALGQMQTLNSGDYSSFQQSPDYQFAMQQGLLGLDNSAAARGSLYSGGQSADVLSYAQGLAEQNYNTYYNRLAGLSGAGQTTATQLGNAGMEMANQIGNYYMNNAQNQASSYYNEANAKSNLYGNLAGIAGNAFGQLYQPSYSQPYSYSQAPGNTTQYGGNSLFGAGVIG